ncbi:MAG: sensor domain-containing protein [Acidimicrobiales bacterium]
MSRFWHRPDAPVESAIVETVSVGPLAVPGGRPEVDGDGTVAGGNGSAPSPGQRTAAPAAEAIGGSPGMHPRGPSTTGNGSDPPRAAGTELRFSAVDQREVDLIAVVDADGRFVFVSASAARVLGYDSGTAVGEDVFSLFDRVSQSTVRSLFDDLLARRRLSVSLELEATRADGRLVVLDAVAANHLDDPIGGIVVSLRDVTEQKSLGRRIEEGQQRHSTIIESLADGVLTVDAAGNVVRVNEAFEVMFGMPRIRAVGRRLEELLTGDPPGSLELLDARGRPLGPEDHPLIVSLRTGRRSVGVVLGVCRPERDPVWIRTNARPMLDTDGTVNGAVASFSDVTDARLAAAELEREERFLQVLLDTLEEGIVACDSDGRITVFNPAARQLHGLPEDADVIGRVPSAHGLRRPDGSAMAPRENPLIRTMSGERLDDVEIILESADGNRRKVSVNGQALIADSGRRIGAVVAMHDVTEQKRNEERLAEMALHDPLTGLANRTLLADRLQEAIDGIAERSIAVPVGGPEGTIQPGVAVYLLDLDEFKEINDELGHDVGDELLLAVARRLTAIVRPTDTVARLGGDEFVVVCEIESGEEEMLRIAERISSALARPYRIGGRILHAVASVGGVFVDHANTDPSKLLSQADDAMYGVKWTRRRRRRSMIAAPED